MPRNLQAAGAKLIVRMCVSCGSPVLDHEIYQACSSCGCAFAQRPPRTYAEMEGLNGNEQTYDVPEAGTYEAWREQRLVERWLWFIFATGLVVSAMLFIAWA